MEATELREKLHQYINNADELQLAEIYNMINELGKPYQYSDDDIACFMSAAKNT